jgi:hypothetical protein
VLHLRRRSDYYDFVLKKRAIPIIGVPKFRVEDLVQRQRFERVERRKTNHVTTKITRNIIPVADFA